MMTVLQWISSRVLTVQHPKVIGITGSIGKTTTKDMIATVLAPHVQMRATEKNYNNELGVPLTIIGFPAPGRSIFRWIGLFLKGLSLCIVKSASYPKVLVLEMGADHVGDIAKLTKMAPCDIGVLTWIGDAHHEAFETKGAVVAEKKVIVTHLLKNGVAIGDIDNQLVAGVLDEPLRATRIVRTGVDTIADYGVRNVGVTVDQISKKPTGLHAMITHGDEHVMLVLSGVVGTAYVHSALLACAVGTEFGIGLHSAVATLTEKFQGTVSRMRIIEGIKHTTIIDDCYNASPQAMMHAVGVLSALPRGIKSKKYAAVGSMLGLGSLTIDAHHNLGRLIAESDIDVLVCVGEEMRATQASALEAGMPETSVFFFAKSAQAGLFLQELLKENDVLLVKGSQDARMEKVVIELMAEPLRAHELVCRSYGKWRSG